MSAPIAVTTSACVMSSAATASLAPSIAVVESAAADQRSKLSVADRAAAVARAYDTGTLTSER